MRSNGTPATSPFPTSPYYASPPSPVPLHHHQPPAQRPYTANHGIPTQFAPGLSEARSYLGDQERPSTGEGFDSGLTTHLRGVDRTSFERSRSGSIDLDSARRAAIGSATAGSNIRPVLRVTAKAGSTVNSSPALSYPQRLPSSSSPTTSPNSAAFDNYLFWKQVPSLPPTDPTPPVLPDLNLSRPESDDFSFIPGITTPPAVPEHPTPPPQEVAPTWQSQNGSYNRSRPISQKAMLGSALEKAHMAVTLDNAGNFEGAVDAYRDACLLLGEVMSRAGGDNDRLKLQTIVRTLIVWCRAGGNYQC